MVTNTCSNPSVKTTTCTSQTVHNSLESDKLSAFDCLKSAQTVRAVQGDKLGLACAFWHPSPQDGGHGVGRTTRREVEWKSTRQCLLNPTSCWRICLLLTLSHHQHAVPPLRPIRPLGPAALLLCRLPSLAPTRVLKVEATPKGSTGQLLQQALLRQLVK